MQVPAGQHPALQLQQHVLPLVEEVRGGRRGFSRRLDPLAGAAAVAVVGVLHLLNQRPVAGAVDDAGEAVPVVPEEAAHLTGGQLGAALRVALVVVRVGVRAVVQQAAAVVEGAADAVAVDVVGVRLVRDAGVGVVRPGELAPAVVGAGDAAVDALLDDQPVIDIVRLKRWS